MELACVNPLSGIGNDKTSLAFIDEQEKEVTDVVSSGYGRGMEMKWGNRNQKIRRFKWNVGRREELQSDSDFDKMCKISTQDQLTL